MERRRHRNTELLEGKTMGIPGPEGVSAKQPQIAEMARQAPEMAFISPSHSIDSGRLHEAHRETRKDSAAGVNGQTAKEYKANLEEKSSASFASGQVRRMLHSS